MILCVGAASRRVVEEAAKLQVAQIVASRRQVGEFEPGYTGYTSATFAETVRALSGGRTQVVRDHGGPYQNGDNYDDWLRAFDADVDAGFNVLHLDVCKLPKRDQPAELSRLCDHYCGRIGIEIGGERDSQTWLEELLRSVLIDRYAIQAAIADFGGRIWADRQCGALISSVQAKEVIGRYAQLGVAVKAHNCDWIGERQKFDANCMYNVAPEFGNVEIDAWLRLLNSGRGQEILNFAYDTGAWQRWFGPGEGTRFERARAALRYHLNSPEIEHVLDLYDDSSIREAIRDAIRCG